MSADPSTRDRFPWRDPRPRRLLRRGGAATHTTCRAGRRLLVTLIACGGILLSAAVAGRIPIEFLAESALRVDGASSESLNKPFTLGEIQAALGRTKWRRLDLRDPLLEAAIRRRIILRSATDGEGDWLFVGFRAPNAELAREIAGSLAEQRRARSTTLSMKKSLGPPTRSVALQEKPRNRVAEKSPGDQQMKVAQGSKRRLGESDRGGELTHQDNRKGSSARDGTPSGLVRPARAGADRPLLAVDDLASLERAREEWARLYTARHPGVLAFDRRIARLRQSRPPQAGATEPLNTLAPTTTQRANVVQGARTTSVEPSIPMTPSLVHRSAKRLSLGSDPLGDGSSEAIHKKSVDRTVPSAPFVAADMPRVSAPATTASESVLFPLPVERVADKDPPLELIGRQTRQFFYLFGAGSSLLFALALLRGVC